MPSGGIARIKSEEGWRKVKWEECGQEIFNTLAESGFVMSEHYRFEYCLNEVFVFHKAIYQEE